MMLGLAPCFSTYYWKKASLDLIALYYLLHLVGAIVLPTGSFGGALPFVIRDVECDGNESSVLSCPFNTTHIQCDSGEGAAIICQGKACVVYRGYQPFYCFLVTCTLLLFSVIQSFYILLCRS